jgi:hypothetical protein
MACVAVFVDAGYLFAQDSTALSGSKKPRTDVKLNETAVMAELTGQHRQRARDARYCVFIGMMARLARG